MRTEESFALMKSAKDIGVAIDADGDRVGGLLNEQDPLPVGDGEPAFDYRRHLRSLRLQLDAARDQVALTEDEHAARLIRVARRRSERKEVASAAYDEMVIARQGLETLYPQGSFELAYLSGQTPRAPERLHEQMAQTVKLLKQPAVELREPKSDSFSLDLEKVVAKLDPAITDLGDAIGRVDLANKEAEGTLVVKREAIQQLRRTVVWVGRTVEGLFVLADEDELAKRIRKSTRRPLRPSEQAAQASPSEASASETAPPEASPLDEASPPDEAEPASPSASAAA